MPCLAGFCGGALCGAALFGVAGPEALLVPIALVRRRLAESILL